MTCHDEDSTLSALVSLLTDDDSHRFRKVLKVILNASMVIERSEHLRTAPFERSGDRNGHANGFKERSFKARVGE